MEAVLQTYQKGEIPGIIAIDPEKCKGCDSCKRHCPTGAIEGKFGFTHSVNVELCVSCGQCLINCPFHAPYETYDKIDEILSKLQDEQVTVAGIIAPAVRVTIGEEFGMPVGSLVTGKLYGAMKKAGFEIFDNNFAADLTIMEEGTEFIQRARHAVFGEQSEHGHHIGPLPQFTSCCPAWVRLVETRYPSLIPHLSSAKSPQQMAGTVAKTYGSQIYGKPAGKIYTVGIMPCTAKKYEASRPEFSSAYAYNFEQGDDAEILYPDIDAVLTTRDLARLLKVLNIDLAQEKEADDSSIFSEYTGAGTIFGNTGGVMEAALRTAYAVITESELQQVELKAVRGMKGVKSADITLHDTKYNQDVTVKVAVVHGTAENLSIIADEVLAGRSPYHFIEVMNCPGGCINGGGNPIQGSGTSFLGRFVPKFAWS